MSADPGPLEVLTMGRSGVDVYPLQVGLGLEDVTSFGKFLGGSPTNVAVAAARLGRRAAVVTGVGDDPFGRFVRHEMRRLGVSDAFTITTDDLTPVTFCEVHPPSHFPLYFYRSPTAPDLQLRPEDVPVEQMAAASIAWFTVTGLSVEPSRAAHDAALAARDRRIHTVLDLDYRSMFWTSPQDATEQVRRVLPAVTVAVGNEEECEVAVGESEPDRAADALLEAGVEIAIVKQGAHGTLAKTRDERVTVSALSVEVVNGLGAGDAFGGALCHGLLSGWSLQRTIEAANAAGAIVASRLECSTAMPSEAQLLAVVDGGVSPDEVSRDT